MDIRVSTDVRRRCAIRAKACREASGLTMAELVSRTGASRATLYGIESDPEGSRRAQYPGVALLITLAKLYGVEPDWLAGLDEED